MAGEFDPPEHTYAARLRDYLAQQQEQQQQQAPASPPQAPAATHAPFDWKGWEPERLNALANAATLGIPRALYEGFKAPGEGFARAYAGDAPSPDETFQMAMQTAGLMAGGGIGRTALGGGVGELGMAGGRPIRAYHGSPHDFERFDLSKIGTGEGAQAYGHGLYFAENEATAKSYRDILSGQSRIPGAPIGRSKYMVGEADVPQGMSGHKALDTSNELDLLLGTMKDNPESSMIPFLKQQIEGRIGRWSQERESMTARGYTGGSADEDMAALADFYHQHVKNAAPGVVKEKPPGRLYEVAINADPEHFLHWDKPFEQQSSKVQRAIKDLWTNKGGSLEGRENPPFVASSSGNNGEAIHAAIATTYGKSGTNANAQAAATQALRDAGIVGVKYLDQGSRTPKILMEGQSIPKDNFAAQQAAESLDLHGSPEKAIASLQKYSPESYGGKAAQEAIRLLQQGKVAKTMPPATHNYVVFDDKLIDIVKKYGMAGLIAGGASHFSMTPDSQPTK